MLRNDSLRSLSVRLTACASVALGVVPVMALAGAKGNPPAKPALPAVKAEIIRRVSASISPTSPALDNKSQKFVNALSTRQAVKLWIHGATDQGNFQTATDGIVKYLQQAKAPGLSAADIAVTNDRLAASASDEIRQKNLTVDAGAQTAVAALATAGAVTMWQQGGHDDPQKQALARANFQRLLDKAAAISASRGPGSTITASDLRIATFSLCPLWPFCS